MDEGFQSASFAHSIADNKSRDGRSGEVELGADLGSSIVFSADFQKFDDLKNQLDCNKDPMKLDAMRRIIGMVARGRDCSELFPAVVKNVVSKNAEVRKLVYLFLTRYAEEQQDVALLSVSAFQRSLKDPNQLTRACALRVLTSIRIPMLVPIMILAIQEASKDLSPYVRKAAAHAVIKVYSLQQEEKEQLIEIIERLLADKTTLVVGSAVRAFEEVCPERLDLIHQNYRRICSLLLDVDEWGQVVIINMLIRYARTQFLAPKQQLCSENGDIADAPDGTEKPSDLINFLADDQANTDGQSSSAESDNVVDTGEDKQSAGYSMKDALPLLQADMDALTNACRFLIYSRNAAVVMAVAQLFFSLESKEDYPAVAKALVHATHKNNEVQYAVLSNIASLTVEHPDLFEPYIRSFYCYDNDPLQIKLLKLEIMNNLANERTSSIILREFQHYVTSSDHEFVAATIQAIGRCASTVPQIADICLNGLVRLMSRPDEKVVAECVVVLRKLLQMQSAENKDVIVRIAQLTDTMTVPSALASILWLLGEYSHRVSRIAPDVLRKMAKTFPSQEPVVKLQVINLAAKLCLVNPRQTKLLAQYVFNLARYDQNYDIRDRSRFLRALIFPQSLLETGAGDSTGAQLASNEGSRQKAVVGYLAKHARKICGSTKPAPVVPSKSKRHSVFRLGSLSHLLSRHVKGYQDLPDWPAIPPNPWSRVVQVAPTSKSVSETHSPAGNVDRQGITTDHSSAASSGRIPTGDFFSDSGDSENEDDVEKEGVEEGQELGDEAVRDEAEEGDVLDGDDESEVELEVQSSSSDSDSDFELTLSQFAMDSKTDQLSTVQHESSKTSSSVSASLGTTVASDSDERTFSSSALKEPKPVGETLRSWLTEGSSSSLETEEDTEEDEDLRDKTLESMLNPPTKPPTNRPDVLNRDSVGDQPERGTTEPEVAVASTAKSLSFAGPEEGEICSKPSTDLVIVDFEGTSDEVSGTSSMTLPVPTPLVESSERNQTGSISPSLSIPIEPLLCPAAVESTPTPLPTLDELIIPSGDSEVVAVKPFPEPSRYEFLCTWTPNPETLSWFESVDPKDTRLHLRYQYSRITWEHNPKLVVLRLGFTNQDTNQEITNLYLDLKSTAFGRLLLDAKRIELFDSIDHLSPQSTKEVFIGIDFAGFTDPIDLSIAYHVAIASEDIGDTVQHSFSIAPPAGELVQPCKMDEPEYFDARVPLIGTKSVTRLDICCFKQNRLAKNPSDLANMVLRCANLGVQFAHTYWDPDGFSVRRVHTAPLNPNQSEDTLTVYFAGRTIADQQLCLVELSLNSEAASHNPCPERGDSTTASVTPALQPDGRMILTVLCKDTRFRLALSRALESELGEATLVD
ncbi:unnamed protein product [Calicophoron daubneyi]|uniref:AP-3 complex subunit beta C-terminal domain-containing protein n=1 Tax=Calicophoron daubneyi TaxID=300641 RepID=A0AAV2TC05_CALDB